MTNCKGPNKNPIGKTNSNMCNYKCNVYFTYPLTSFIARKKIQYIEMKASDLSAKPNVTFNNMKYTSTDILLFNTPLHEYIDDTSVGAELVIVHHKQNSTNEKLYICVPIRVVENNHFNNGVLSRVIKDVKNNDESATQIDLSNFKFSNFIPKTTYYNYRGSTIPLYDEIVCSNKCEYIVFNAENSNIFITGDEKKILSDLIGEHSIVRGSKSEIFLSENPPGLIDGDDIYIDCQPVGQDKPKFVAVKDIGAEIITWFSASKILTALTPYILIIIGFLIMFLIWKFIGYLYSPKCAEDMCTPDIPGVKKSCDVD